MITRSVLGGGNWNGQNSVRRQEHPFLNAAYPGYNAQNTTSHGWKSGGALAASLDGMSGQP